MHAYIHTYVHIVHTCMYIVHIVYIPIHVYICTYVLMYVVHTVLPYTCNTHTVIHACIHMWICTHVMFMTSMIRHCKVCVVVALLSVGTCDVIW